MAYANLLLQGRTTTVAAAASFILSSDIVIHVRALARRRGRSPNAHVTGAAVVGCTPILED